MIHSAGCGGVVEGGVVYLLARELVGSLEYSARYLITQCLKVHLECMPRRHSSDLRPYFNYLHNWLHDLVTYLSFNSNEDDRHDHNDNHLKVI